MSDTEEGATDDSGNTLHYYESLSALFYTTTALSLVTNLIVCVFHGCLTFYKVMELNRISLRLTVLACFFEVLRAVFRIAMIVPANGSACSADAFFVSWADIASPLCLALVALHTVCVLVLNVNYPLRLEKYYYATIFLYSVFVSSVATRHGPADYLAEFHCWIRYYFGKKNVNEFKWTWYFTAQMIPIAVAVVCVLILLIRYKMERFNFATTSVRYARSSTSSALPVISNRFRHVNPIKIFRDVIIRTSHLKMSGIVAGFESLLNRPVDYKSLIAGGVLTNVQGLLISILYLSDPAVVYTMKRFGHFLRVVYVDDYCLPSNKSMDLSPSPPDSFEERMRDQYDFDNSELEDENWGTAIQLTPIHYDMIAADALEDHRFRRDGGDNTNDNDNNNNNNNDNDNNHRRQRRRSSAHLWGKSYSSSPWDPYYNRCLAKTMHWLLTKVCRLKPLPFNESTSTLSYQSYALASNNSLPIVMTENHTQQQQQQQRLSIDGDDDGERKVTNATKDITKHSKNKIDVGRESNGTTTTKDGKDDHGAHMDHQHRSNKGGKNRKGDNNSKHKKDRQGKGGMAADSLPVHPTADSTPQHLMIPNKISANAARRSSSSSTSSLPLPLPPASTAEPMSLSSPSSPDYMTRTPTSAIRSSDEEEKSFNSGRRGTLSSSPLSALRFARRSRKFRAAMLHHRHENSNPPEPSTTPTASSASPSPSSSAASPPLIPDELSPPSSKPSSLHLSQTSSLHLPGISSSTSEIDRLSQLSSIESGNGSTKSFEPLTAPPHHYYHGRQRRRRQRRRQQVRHRH
ncbi:unnamed protein product [Absidia cylindrospora]